MVFLTFALVACCNGARAYASTCPAGADHSYHVTIAHYASGTKDGLRVYTCTKCGDRYEQVIPATGHRWGSWVVDVKATCTTPGHRYRECNRHHDAPHYEEQTIAPYSATGTHSYVLIAEDTPTCIEGGQLVYRCDVCGDSFAESTPARGYRWGAWEITKEVSALEEPLERRVCLNDSSHVEVRTIAVLGGVEKLEAENSTEKPSVSKTPSTFFSGPTTFDAVALGIDAGVLIVCAVLTAPLLHQVSWLKRKHTEARNAFVKQMSESKGGVRL